MKNTRTIVLTSRRPVTGFGYLRNLLNQFPVDAVYVDGGLEDAREFVARAHVTYSGKRMGSARATHAALKWASTHWPGKRILFLEDDVLPAVETDELLRWVDSLEPLEALYCLCDMRELEEGAKPGVYSVSALGAAGDGWWGNQALLFRADTVRWVADQDWFSEAIEGSDQVQLHKQYWRDGGVQCSDVRLGLLVDSHPVRNKIGVHVPSLFYHTGEDSICFPGEALGKHRTRNIAGLKGYREFERAFAQGHLTEYLAGLAKGGQS
jgi:hypothetical protein